MNHAIYIIFNIINDKCYVGSAVNLKLRWKNHKIGLYTGKHHNKHLLAAYNKYGCENFIYVKVETVDNKQDLIAREQWWIDRLNPEYNKAPRAGSPLGVKHSDETKAKLSAMRKGQRRSEEYCKALSERMTGFKFSDESREKMRLAHIGKTQSDETIIKRSKKLIGNKYAAGFKQTAEHIEARAASRRGKSNSAEHRAKISESNKGRTFSEETKLKMSIAAKNRSSCSDETKRKLSEAAKAQHARKRLTNGDFSSSV